MEPPLQPVRDHTLAEIKSVLLQAVQVGTLSGLSGLFVGGVAGILRTSTPALFAVASGVQWFTLGTSFWGTRGLVLYSSRYEHRFADQKFYASTFAGAVSGGAGGVLRSHRNVIPGMIVFAMLGGAGQKILDTAEANHVYRTGEVPLSSSKASWLVSRWSPVTALTDESYEILLKERVLQIDADIALTDEAIASLKRQGRG